MSAQPVVLQVVILRDGLLVGTEVFVPGSYAIGSGPQVDLRLDDSSVQPQQAVLYFQNGKAAIQDMGGGVYVNGIKITACEVRSMDELSVGPFVLKVRVVAQKAPTSGLPPEVARLLAGSDPVTDPVKNPPPGASWPAMPSVPKGSSQVTYRQPKLMPTPAPLAGSKATVAAVSAPLAKGTVASARRMAAGNAAPAAPPPVPHKPPTKSQMPAVPHKVQVPDPEEATNADMVSTLGQVTNPAVRPPEPPPAAEQPSRPDKKGGKRTALRLYYELHWKGSRHSTVSFAHSKKPISAGTEKGPEFPYWGFDVPKGEFPIAHSAKDTFRVFLPTGAKVDRRTASSPKFSPIGPSDLEQDGTRYYLAVGTGGQVRIRSGDMTLYATVKHGPEKLGRRSLKTLPWLLLSLLTLEAGGIAAWFIYGPKAPEEADFNAKGLNPVAVRLSIQKPEKKKAAQEKIEQIKAKEKEKAPETKAEKKITKMLPKKVVEVAPAETKALKQLAKLTAAGPAMGDMLAAVDKLGNGPGAKNARSSFKLSGLVGKAPIANAGLGTFGLGGGGKGGIGTLGAEILRGRGGGGIGAMGAGGVGKGAVGGMVTQATSRSVGVPQGNIDRDAVAKCINSHLQEVRACYERALIKDPGLAGKVVLEWTISQTGSVAAAKTKSSSLRNATVESCILATLKTWDFPKPRGGVVIISYPFLFNSVGF